MSQFKTGMVLSYVNILVVNVIGLLLTPFIIKSLGVSEYGLYALIGSFIAYLGILDFGMNNAVIRYVAKYKLNNDKYAEQNFLATSLLVYICISGLIAIIGMLIYLKSDDLYSATLTITELDKAKTMLLILILNLMFSLPGGIFTAICTGYERFIFSKSITLLKYFCRSSLVVVILMKGGDAISIVIIDTMINLLMVLVSGFYVLTFLKVKFKLHKLDLTLLKNIFSYSVWIFLSAITFNFYWHSGQIITGLQEDTTAVAIFSVGILLGGYYGAFSSAINSMLVPKAIQVISNKFSPEELTVAMTKYGRLNLLVLLLVLSGFYIFGEDFLKLWVGESFKDSFFISLLIMLALTPVLVQGFGNSILEAMRKNKFKALLSMVTTSTGVLTGWFFSKSYGINGLVIPLTASMLLNSIIMMLYYKKIFNLNIFKFLLNTYFRSIIIILPLALLCNYIFSKYSNNSWIGLISGICIYTTIYLIFNYLFILNNEEKSHLKVKFL